MGKAFWIGIIIGIFRILGAMLAYLIALVGTPLHYANDNRFTNQLRLWRLTTLRLYLSKKYIHGSGLEIGALHKPLRLFNGANVLYVDRKTVDELRSDYPELNDHSLVDIDIIDDGERLNTIDDSSADFIVASHFLEHCEDPIMTIETFIRILRPDGILFLAVPDKRLIDKNRSLTNLEHLIVDHRFGPTISREDHFKEYEECVVHRPVKRDYSIHYHVWTYKEIVELLSYLECKKELGISTKKVAKTRFENIFVVRKK